MPLKDLDSKVVEYPLAKRGVNFYSNIVEIHPEEALLTQNLVYGNGMVKRAGQAKFESDEVSASKRITGLHRFYYSTSSKQLIASSGTTIKYHDGATWQNVRTGLTDDKQTYFTTWLDDCYIANATDVPSYWDGSTDTSLTAAPANTKMFLPYQDRLLSITGGDLTWSGSFDNTTWETVANCGVRPDTQLFGMIIHSVTNISTGYQAQVLLAGANGMYLFAGSDLRVPAISNGDYTIYSLAVPVGCNSPRTMQWTPRGTIWLGIDRQVYILPFNSNTPIPIGDKIRSNRGDVEGIESIPAAQLENCSATYHNGYYMLSFAPSGGSYNYKQFWLDITRLGQDDDGLWGPWYGPMTGQQISCFVVQNGMGDSGELLGGESDASTGSYVYSLNQKGTYSDDGTAIQVYYQTFYNGLGTLALRKDVHRLEAELLDITSSINVDFFDIDGTLKTGDNFSLTSSAVYWNDGGFWGDGTYFTNSVTRRHHEKITPAIQPRRLSIGFSNSSSDEDFVLNALRVEALEQNLIFG